MKKQNKYQYWKIIQQFYGSWEDVSQYEANSQGIVTEMSGKFIETKSGRKRELTAISADVIEYRLLGYPTRVIFRKELTSCN